jgi:hypothetical protein
VRPHQPVERCPKAIAKSSVFQVGFRAVRRPNARIPVDREPDSTSVLVAVVLLSVAQLLSVKRLIDHELPFGCDGYEP